MAERHLVSSGAAVGVAGALANALSYFVPLLGARELQANDFSLLITVMALFTIASVPGQGLQMALAVRVARQGRVAPEKLSLLTACVTVAVLLVISPLLVRVLYIPWPTMLLTVATTAPAIVIGGWLGVLQGEQRFARLAVGITLLGMGRCFGVILGLAFGLGLTAVLAAGLAGTVLSAAAVRWLTLSSDGSAAFGVRREVIEASLVNLAMLVISYADLIAARHLLSATQAADYGALNVITKGALWAPQMITVLALPYLAQGRRRALPLAAAAMTIVGAALVAATTFAGELAMGVIGGDRYVNLAGDAPLFAATGALFALLFLLMNVQIADGSNAPSIPIWLATAGFGLVVMTMPAPSVDRIVACALATAAIIVAFVGVTVFRRHRQRGHAGLEPISIGAD